MDPATLEALAIVFSVIGGGIMGIYHIIVKRIRNSLNHENHESLIDDRVTKLECRLDDFQKWAISEHEEMNKEASDKIDGLKKEMGEVKNAISENTGYLKALIKKTP